MPPSVPTTTISTIGPGSTKYGYDLDALFAAAEQALRKHNGGVGDVVDAGECRRCGSRDNPLVVDVHNNQHVCTLCGSVDPEPIQCEWNNASQKLELGRRRHRRQGVIYNHTYYFSEKMRCANAEGIPPWGYHPFFCWAPTASLARVSMLFINWLNAPSLMFCMSFTNFL